MYRLTFSYTPGGQVWRPMCEATLLPSLCQFGVVRSSKATASASVQTGEPFDGEHLSCPCDVYWFRLLVVSVLSSTRNYTCRLADCVLCNLSPPISIFPLASGILLMYAVCRLLLLVYFNACGATFTSLGLPGGHLSLLQLFKTIGPGTFTHGGKCRMGRINANSQTILQITSIIKLQCPPPCVKLVEGISLCKQLNGDLLIITIGPSANFYTPQALKLSDPSDLCSSFCQYSNCEAGPV